MTAIRIFVNEFRGAIVTDSLTYEQALARLADPNDVLNVVAGEDDKGRRYAIPVRSIRAISEETR